MKPNVKVLVAYHKPCQLFDSDVLVPIHLGRKLAMSASKDGEVTKKDYEWLCENMIGDDTGDNISELNREFCELTALYWAWKNYKKLGNPEYTGLMHYRRLFAFDSSQINASPDWCHMMRVDFASKSEPEKLGYDKKLYGYLGKKTCIVCENKHNDTTPYEYHKNLPLFNQENYAQGLRFVRERLDNPEYLDEYLYGHRFFWSNMFIVSKDVFFEYCEYMFPILLDFMKVADWERASLSERRFMGYLAESISGAFWIKKEHEGYNIVSFPVEFIEHPDLIEDIKPAFKKNNVAISFSSDDNYVPYLSVAIQSIIDNASPKENYDIVVLKTNIARYKEQKIQRMAINHKNISIRFVDVSYLANKFKSSITSNFMHYNQSIYYRYFIQEIFKNYSKVLYLDCDVLLRSDIAELYNQDLKGHIIGAIRDIERARWLKSEKRQDTLKFDRSLGIMDSYQYFNSGVCLFNVNKMKEISFMEKALNLTELWLKKVNWIGDQDIINSICFGDVQFIDAAWNMMWIVNIFVKHWDTELDEESLLAYKKSIKNCKLIHYCDTYKPWKNIDFEFADFWWECARHTPFYEELLLKNVAQKTTSTSTVTNIKISDVLHQIRKYKRKLFVHRLLKHISFGKMHKKQQRSFNEYKDRLNNL